MWSHDRLHLECTDGELIPTLRMPHSESRKLALSYRARRAGLRCGTDVDEWGKQEEGYGGKTARYNRVSSHVVLHRSDTATQAI